MTVTQTLQILETGGLIHLAAVQPELEYAFQHALIQDAAYLTLVKANRRLLHKAVGESLEQLYPGQLTSPTLAPVLARHFAEAGDPARALNYYRLAGRAAADRHANAEAIHYFSQGLEIATKLASAGEAAADLFLRRGRALELNAQDAGAIQNYQEQEAWAEAHGNQPAQLSAMTRRATIYVKPSIQQNLDLGYDLSQRALALARELGDRTAEAKVLWNLLQHQIASGDLDQALEYANQALRIARADGLREQIAHVLTDVWKVYFILGQPEQALAAVDEAQAIWRELGVLNMLSDNLATIAMLNSLVGHYSQALAYSDEANQLSRMIGNLWNESYSLYMLDLVHFERGDIGRAITVAEDCVLLAEQAGFADALNGTSQDLALIYAYMGALPQALSAAHDFQARARILAVYVDLPLQADTLTAYLHSSGGQLAAAQALLDRSPFTHQPDLLNEQFVMMHLLYAVAQAEVALANGQPQPALQLADGLIAHFQRTGVRLCFADALWLRGRTLVGNGRFDEAQSALEAARAEAEQVGSRRMLWLILSELAALAERRGDHQAALGLWRPAAEIIGYIAEHAGSAELRESFLNRPNVRQTLAKAAPPAA